MSHKSTPPISLYCWWMIWGIVLWFYFYTCSTNDLFRHPSTDQSIKRKLKVLIPLTIYRLILSLVFASTLWSIDPLPTFNNSFRPFISFSLLCKGLSRIVALPEFTDASVGWINSGLRKRLFRLLWPTSDDKYSSLDTAPGFTCSISAAFVAFFYHLLGQNINIQS